MTATQGGARDADAIRSGAAVEMKRSSEVRNQMRHSISQCGVLAIALGPCLFSVAPVFADEPPGTAAPSVPAAASVPSTPSTATGVKPPHDQHGSLAEVGAKLSDPTSDVWALFTQFGLTFSDGDINNGDAQLGANMTFEPVLPIPLYGTGKDEWKLLVRPTIPILFGNPVPQGFDDFNHETGFGDMLLPLPVVPPRSMTGNWLLGLGPTFTIPTSTRDAFGRQQWAVGPSAILGYKTKKIVAVVFPQYFFGIGSRGDQGSKPDASNMDLLYAFYYNLPQAWQVGFNPTITFDSTASSGNKWNVPIGLLVAKTTAIGGRPWKFQLGFEYGVLTQDTFGQEFQVKLNVIPVIGSLIKKPLFGGN